MGAATLFDKIWTARGDISATVCAPPHQPAPHARRRLLGLQGAEGEGLPRAQSGADLRHIDHVSPPFPDAHGDQPSPDAASLQHAVDAKAPACACSTWATGPGIVHVIGRSWADSAGRCCCAATATPAPTAAWRAGFGIGSSEVVHCWRRRHRAAPAEALRATFEGTRPRA